MSAFDAELMFRTNGDLTASESLGPVRVPGGVMHGHAVRVIVPDALGANDTILPKIHVSQDGSTYNLLKQYAGGAVKTKGGKEFVIPFNLPTADDDWYVKLELDVTVASTTAGFGAVIAGVVLPVNEGWSRESHWG
ncbi:MAG: hypothetical protein GXY44_06520 [Phycisphaerales bacterium]|nr:hypothetical protein [Phycisphaerales bacterium]